MENSSSVENGIIKIVRVFNKPIDKVWEAWSNPEIMMKWWGPEGFTSPKIEIDFKVGGKYLLCMKSPDGREMWNAGIYKEIVPNEKIVFTQSMSNENGDILDPADFGMKDFPKESIITILFEEIDGKTKMTLTQDGMPDNDMAQGATYGWAGAFNKLESAIS